MKKLLTPTAVMICFVLALVLRWQAPAFCQDAETRFLSPDSVRSAELASHPARAKQLFGIRDTDEGLEFSPVPRPEETWLAVKDFPYQNRRASFFFVEGWLYTDTKVLTSHRLKYYQKNVTHLVQSNVFTLAFYTEKGLERELAIFIAAMDEKDAELRLDKRIWGEEQVIRYHLRAGEGHFLSTIKLPEEARPVFFPHRQARRQHFSLNTNWRFGKGEAIGAQQPDFDDAAWPAVSLPHTWNASDVFDHRNMKDGYDLYHGYYRGPGWYRKRFRVAQRFKDRRVFLNFEGANQVAEVWVNGTFIGKHVGGYTGFRFDITDQVKYGKAQNLLAVRVDNSYSYDIPPHSADFDMYGGLYRDVWLEMTHPLHIASLAITTPELSVHSGRVRIIAQLKNQPREKARLRFVANVLDAEDQILTTGIKEGLLAAAEEWQTEVASAPILFPRLWHPEDPYLHRVAATLYCNDQPVDEIVVPFGFRWYTFTADSGFFLNGKPLKLRGVNRHQDRLGLGNAVPDSLHVQDMALLKEMGANFVRLAHYPQDPAVLDACDRLGLLVWQEIPVVNSIGGANFTENARRMLIEMIRRDRNHPSIILWGISNEVARTFSPKRVLPQVFALYRMLNETAHREDPTRLTVHAHNFIQHPGLADIPDVVGRNRYFGWYKGTLADFGNALDQEHAQHPNWKLLISEYGAGAKRGYHTENPHKYDFSEEYQVAFHQPYLDAIEARPWLAGGLVWNGFDFGSTVKKGNAPRFNQKGVFDMARRPKDVFYFYKSRWSETPMVYIVSHTWRHRTGPPGETKKVQVFSNCDTVTLFLNGKSLGEKSDRWLWEAVFREGENVLEAHGRKAGTQVSDRISVWYQINNKP